MPLTEEQKAQQTARQQIQAAPQQEQAVQNEQQNQALLQTERTAPAEEAQLREAQANETLAAQIRQELPAAQAVQAAEGAPVQEQEPAPSTWKERRTERKKAEAAGKVCPVGTAATYDMVEQLKERRKTIQESLHPYLNRDAARGEGGRCMRAYCQGYRTNRFGFPASQEDKRKKRENERFLRDYCTNSLETRRPHLDRIVDELINTRFSLDMFTPRNLRRNLAELKSLGERLTYIQNLKIDNREYFEELKDLDPGKWEMLDAVNEMGAAFVPLLMAHCQINGVDVNAAEYFDRARKSAIREGHMNLEPLTENFKRALKEYQRKGVYGTYADKLEGITLWGEDEPEELRQAAVCHADHLRRADQAFGRLREDPRLGIPWEDLAPEAVKKAKAVLVPDEAHAEENIQTIRLMQELEQNKDQKPPADLYVRTRAFAAPFVERVLDCHLDYMLDLPLSMLVRDHAGELEKLARESRLAADLLRLRHPVQEAGGHGRLALGDELLGSKGNEFAYRCAMVQALAKKARMSALLANGSLENMRIGEEYLTEEERREAAGAPEFLIRQRLVEAEEEMQAAKKKYEDVQTPGTEEFKKWAQDIMDRGKLEREVIDIAYEPVITEFEKMETPEIRQAMDRIQAHPYYSLAYTKEQREALGMPENVGEPLFRSFGPFLKKEAAKKLLSPEKFRQMLLDLGAGAGMHCGTWESNRVEKRVDGDGKEHFERRTVQQPGTPEEELEPAVQKNRAGLDVYKQIMRAQYDMITRKYGSSLENLDVADMVNYCNDFFRDFGETQLEDNMISRYPGFLDLENEEDKLLFYRIKYYGSVGTAVYTLYAHLDPRRASKFDPMIQSKSDIQYHMQGGLTDPQVVEAREYLETHDQLFHHESLNPFAKVRTPE